MKLKHKSRMSSIFDVPHIYKHKSTPIEYKYPKYSRISQKATKLSKLPKVGFTVFQQDAFVFILY